MPNDDIGASLAWKASQGNLRLSTFFGTWVSTLEAYHCSATGVPAEEAKNFKGRAWPKVPRLVTLKPHNQAHQTACDPAARW